MSLSRMANQLPDDADPASAPAREAPFLADSYAEDWERIERYAARRRFSGGEQIVRRGEIDRSLIVVLGGELGFYAAGPDGEERLVSIIEAPSLVGEVAFFDSGPRAGTLRARSDGELLKLSFEQFEALAAASPSLARLILLDAGRLLARRLRMTMGAEAH